MTILLIIAVGVGAWGVCSWASYRVFVTYMMTEFSTLHFSNPSQGLKYDGGKLERKDRRMAVMLSALGPLSLVVLYFTSSFQHGWRIPPPEGLRELALKQWEERFPGSTEAARSAGAKAEAH